MPPKTQERARVVIAGAGVAGLEAALALRAFAPDRAAVELIDPRERFRLAATATGRAFGTGSGVDLPLPRLAARAVRPRAEPPTRRSSCRGRRRGSPP